MVSIVLMNEVQKKTFYRSKPGAHSYEGYKSSYITDANQLTISMAAIENVETGLGNDVIIGNELLTCSYLTQVMIKFLPAKDWILLIQVLGKIL